jgi:hypothetical protein
MAMFQQYQSGIQPVTGMAEAGANIGNMYAQGLSNLGKGLAEGIKAYNDNSAKNELANVKIQSLSQDVANKIAMYSQDPEIAQSGVLEGLMQTAATLQDAPTKGLSQRLGLVHDAEAKLAGFGQQLQEWSFLRGRQIERGIADALQKFAGTVTTTDSIDVNDPMFNVNPNETITQTKDRLFKILGEVKKLNPNAQINNDEFYARWLAKAEQEVANAKDIDPRIISAQLEAIQAEKNIQKQNRLAQGMTATDIPSYDAIEDYAGEPKMNTVKDYEAMMATPADVVDFEKADPTTKELIKNNPKEALLYRKKTAEENIDYLTQQLKSSKTEKERQFYQKEIDTEKEGLAEVDKAISSGFATSIENFYQRPVDTKESIKKKLAERKAKELLPKAQENAVVSEFAKSSINNVISTLETAIQSYADISINDLIKGNNLFEIQNNPTVQAVKFPYGSYGVPSNTSLPSRYSGISDKIAAEAKKLGISPDKPMSADQMGSLMSALNAQEADTNKKAEEERTKLEKTTPENMTVGVVGAQKAKTPVPTIGVGDVVVGTQERTRPVSVSERKSQVQDFLTQRFGAVDPTDPTGKRRIPVQGFDQFFAKAVPESEVREFTTDSGIRLLQINGKWEQVKAPERPSIQDIRKERIGVFGQQTADGRLVPTEFVPDSGVYLGGLYRGTDAGADKFTDEVTQLIDARRGVKRLQEINDKFGEAFSLKDSGEAAVEVMNLKAALRTDIIGVGTVSNFEQALIDKVIKDPTEFLSMEPRDRAILLALANRIDRRIKNISSSRGLTVQIRDTGSTASRYEDIRQRYLREKGLL